MENLEVMIEKRRNGEIGDKELNKRLAIFANEVRNINFNLLADKYESENLCAIKSKLLYNEMKSKISIDDVISGLVDEIIDSKKESGWIANDVAVTIGLRIGNEMKYFFECKTNADMSHNQYC